MANEYGRKASSSGAESAGIGRRDPKSCIKCLGGSSAKLVATTDNPEWTKRFGQRIDNARLPNDEAERTELALVIGRDGHYLLEQIYATSEQLEYLQQIPAVETLRQVWIQQYCWQEGQLEWRKRHKHGMAPAAITIISPYDLEARYGQKRTVSWLGYKVHLTETCDDDNVHLITHVETTTAAVPDNQVVDNIHEALDEKELLPEQHLVDAGYPDGENIVDSQDDYQVALFGPVRPDNGWQAREATGYDASQFHFDWETPRATCPQGIQSYRGKAGIEGTVSQAVYALTMRRSRYRGQAKTHLQHVATAAAMNLMRVINWLNGLPMAETRESRFAQLAPA